MIDTTSSQAQPRRSFVGRILGVLVSPQSTYADIVERPAWLGLLLVVLLATIVPTTILMATTIGRQALLDGQIQTMEAVGRTVSDAQYQAIQRVDAFAPYLTSGYTLVFLLVAALALSGLSVAIFDGILGGKARFVQVFAVVVGSQLVLALRSVFAAPLNYARETLTSPTSLGALLPFFADDTFAARLLGAIDLFVLWWAINLAIGLGVLYKRRTGPIAVTLVGVYLAIGLTIALVRSLLVGA
jgi:hypothetical protein